MADWLKIIGLHKLCSVFEGIKNFFILSLDIYILLDVLLCTIAEYFYELCGILASP